MKDSIQFLFKKNEVRSKFNIGINNCKHLAKRIFDRFAGSTLKLDVGAILMDMTFLWM